MLNQLFAEQKICVKQINMDQYGGLILCLGENLRVERFPYESVQEKFWRLIEFRKDTDSLHFVVYEG